MDLETQNPQVEEQATAPTPSILLTSTHPIVLKGKRKKRKYSRGLRDIQTFERRMSKSNEKMAKAVVKGWKEYRKSADKSSRKRRDGVLVDMNVNMARGFSRMLEESSGLPLQWARAGQTRGFRKATRRQLRTFARVNRLMRLR